MFIGELARATGASAKAIRLYESLGLLGPVRRRGCYRIYGDRDCQRIRIIRQAQGLGFRLSELAPLLQTPDGEPDWPGLARQLELKQASLRREVRRLNRLDREIAGVKAEIALCLGQAEPAAAAGLCGAMADPLP